MADQRVVLEVLYSAVDAFNEQSPEENRLEKNADAPLFGPKGRLDSMGLVHFIFAAEEAIQGCFQVCVTLADDAAMSQRRSPFRSLAALAEHAASLLRASGVPECPRDAS
jgi:hypothetical protein